jgi:hypothetical protein
MLLTYPFRNLRQGLMRPRGLILLLATLWSVAAVHLRADLNLQAALLVVGAGVSLKPSINHLV